MFRLVVFLTLAFGVISVPAFAFHDGGVASCQGCHVMHESEDGQLVMGAEDLLRAESATDLCLGCHANANGAVFGVAPLMPSTELGGGNFIFLLEDNLNDFQNGARRPISGEAAGHSVVAPSAGLLPDSRWLNSPGGNFASADLGCTSCHDPHGNGNFRMLNGAGSVQNGLFSFTADAPQAEGIDLNGAPEGAANHTAYQGGWAQWCGNCHGDRYHSDGQSRFEHPAEDSFGGDISDRYNLYLGDANPLGGSPATSYLALVPFEDASATSFSSAGPGAGSRVSCISCHRAHGSSGPASGRWDFRISALGDDGVVSGSLPIPNPYADPGQRILCVKCHDEDHGNGRGCLNCHGGVPASDPGVNPVLPGAN
jgi:predicted CXXCH cytochrome family protein